MFIQNTDMMQGPLHVEIVQRLQSRLSKDRIKEIVHTFLSNFVYLVPGESLSACKLEECPELATHVESITFCNLEYEQPVSPLDVELHYLIHRLDARGAETDCMTEVSGEECPAVELWALPAREFHGLWESLIFDEALKRDTVRLVESALELGALGVDPLAVCWNRVVLLHGPPGTGKTSLCRALAHKLAVRLGERFPRARLLEINAHSLFSKWFAESGKLVARLFERVREIAADPRLLACVLVDEVESLATARRAALAGLEPSDAVRAVNALLSQLDQLRQLPNVLVLTTSNVTGAIDVAFADRADIKRRVGPPSARAAYSILRHCCSELMTRGVVKPLASLATVTEELELVACEAAAAQVSGRALRRLPFLAHALHAPRPPTLPQFVTALHAALRQHLKDDHEFHEDDLHAKKLPNGH